MGRKRTTCLSSLSCALETVLSSKGKEKFFRGTKDKTSGSLSSFKGYILTSNLINRLAKILATLFLIQLVECYMYICYFFFLVLGFSAKYPPSFGNEVK